MTAASAARSKPALSKVDRFDGVLHASGLADSLAIDHDIIGRADT